MIHDPMHHRQFLVPVVCLVRLLLISWRGAVLHTLPVLALAAAANPCWQQVYEPGERPLADKESPSILLNIRSEPSFQ